MSILQLYSDTPEEGIGSYYRWLWATLWLLGIELRTSARAASAVNCWAISPAPTSLFLKILKTLSFLWGPALFSACKCHFHCCDFKYDQCLHLWFISKIILENTCMCVRVCDVRICVSIVYACVCVCVHVCVYVLHLCVHMEAKEGHGCSPISFSAFFPWDNKLCCWTRSWLAASKLQDSSYLAPSCWDHRCKGPHLAFYARAGDSNFWSKLSSHPLSHLSSLQKTF